MAITASMRFSSVVTFQLALWVIDKCGSVDVANLVYIEGLPVAHNDGIIVDHKFMYPQECDQFCSNSEQCESFSWNSQTSNCRFYPWALDPGNFVKIPHIFWMTNGYRQLKLAKGDSALVMNDYNNYLEPTASTSGTSSATASYTSSLTSSLTSSKTSSPTSSMTSSETSSLTSSMTSSETSSLTSSMTSSETSSLTSNLTSSETSSPTSSMTSSETSSPTSSMTSSETSSPTSSLTSSLTSSFTSSETSSFTSSETSSPTSSMTSSETSSPTSSLTSSSTSSETSSPTSSMTSSETSSLTSSMTSSETSSLTSSMTSSETSSLTSSLTSSETSSLTSSLTSSETTSQTLPMSTAFPVLEVRDIVGAYGFMIVSLEQVVLLPTLQVVCVSQEATFAQNIKYICDDPVNVVDDNPDTGRLLLEEYFQIPWRVDHFAMQNINGEHYCYERSGGSPPHTWSYSPTHCEELNNFFCPCALNDQSMEAAIFSSFANHYAPHSPGELTMTDGNRYGFLYLGEQTYALLPSEIGAKWMDRKDPLCTSVATNVFGSDQSGDDILARLQPLPHIFTVLLKNEQDHSVCWQRTSETQWTREGATCSDTSAQKFTLCETALNSSGAADVVSLHMQVKVARVRVMSSNSGYGFYHFGDGIYAMYPERVIKRITYRGSPYTDSDLDPSFNLIDSTATGVEMLQAMGVNLDSDEAFFLYDNLMAKHCFVDNSGTLTEDCEVVKSTAVYLETVENPTSVGLTQTDLDDMERFFLDYFTVPVMQPQMVDAELSLGRYGCIVVNAAAQSYILLPTFESVTVCQSPLAQIKENDIYMPVNVFDIEPVALEMLQMFTRFVTQTTRKFVVYDLLKRHTCFKFETGAWSLDSCDFGDSWTPYFFFCWVAIADNEWQSARTKFSELMGFDVWENTGNVVDVGSGGLGGIRMKYLQYALYPSLQTVQISAYPTAVDSVYCETPVGHYFDDGAALLQTFKVNQYYHIVRFALQQQTGTWTCFRHDTPSGWSSVSCGSDQFYYFCLATPPDWSITTIRNAHYQKAGLPIYVYSSVRYTRAFSSDGVYGLQVLANNIFMAYPSNKMVTLVDSPTRLSSGKLDANCDRSTNLVRNIDDAVEIASAVLFNTAIVDKLAFLDPSNNWIRIKTSSVHNYEEDPNTSNGKGTESYYFCDFQPILWTNVVSLGGNVNRYGWIQINQWIGMIIPTKLVVRLTYFPTPFTDYAVACESPSDVIESVSYGIDMLDDLGLHKRINRMGMKMKGGENVCFERESDPDNWVHDEDGCSHQQHYFCVADDLLPLSDSDTSQLEETYLELVITFTQSNNYIYDGSIRFVYFGQGIFGLYPSGCIVTYSEEATDIEKSHCTTIDSYLVDADAGVQLLTHIKPPPHIEVFAMRNAQQAWLCFYYEPVTYQWVHDQTVCEVQPAFHFCLLPSSHPDYSDFVAFAESSKTSEGMTGSTCQTLNAVSEPATTAQNPNNVVSQTTSATTSFTSSHTPSETTPHPTQHPINIAQTTSNGYGFVVLAQNSFRLIPSDHVVYISAEGKSTDLISAVCDSPLDVVDNAATGSAFLDLFQPSPSIPFFAMRDTAGNFICFQRLITSAGSGQTISWIADQEHCALPNRFFCVA